MSLVNDFKRFYKITPVTAIVILLAVAVSLLTLFGNNYQLVSLLIYNNELIASGQIWRLITPIFLHFSMFGVFFCTLPLIYCGFGSLPSRLKWCLVVGF